jgi:DNA-directed RNA polymerase alpha subunit
LGLIPLNVDARLFDDMEEGDEPTDSNTLVFKLSAKCPVRKPPPTTRSRGGSEGGDTASQYTFSETEKTVIQNTELDEAAFAAARKTAIETPGRPYTMHVYSKDLEFVPQGDQENRFPDGIRPVHEDILVAKLRPGQEIELEAHARRGIGKDHAKFSPVSTACYRLYTHVELLEPVYDKDAEDLVHLYEPGVFELVTSTVTGKRVEAKVSNPYACTMSRNYMKNPTLAKAIKMTRIPNHFIFSVESVGMHQPAVLVAEAIRTLQAKCEAIIDLTKEQEDAFM